MGFIKDSIAVFDRVHNSLGMRIIQYCNLKHKILAVDVKSQQFFTEYTI